jgi:hypothetical protein
MQAIVCEHHAAICYIVQSLTVCRDRALRCWTVQHSAQTYNSMELSHYWEAVSSSDSQKFPLIFCNTKVHYRVHKSPSFFSILSQMYLVYPASTLISLRSTLILSSLYEQVFQFVSFPQVSQPKSCMYFCFPPICATGPARLILLNLFILIMFGDEQKSRSSSLRHFL